MRYLQRIQSTNVSVHEYIFAQQIFTWKTKQVFALEARMKWKKPHSHVNTTAAHSTSCQRKYEQVSLSPFASNKQKCGFLGTELSQRAVVFCLQNASWA